MCHIDARDVVERRIEADEGMPRDIWEELLEDFLTCWDARAHSQVIRGLYQICPQTTKKSTREAVEDTKETDVSHGGGAAATGKGQQ